MDFLRDTVASELSIQLLILGTLPMPILFGENFKQENSTTEIVGSPSRNDIDLRYWNFTVVSTAQSATVPIKEHIISDEMLLVFRFNRKSYIDQSPKPQLVQIENVSIFSKNVRIFMEMHTFS